MAKRATPAERLTRALRYMQQRCMPSGYSLEFFSGYEVPTQRHRVHFKVTDHRGNSKAGAVLINAKDLQLDSSPVYDHITEATQWLMALDNQWGDE